MSQRRIPEPRLDRWQSDEPATAGVHDHFEAAAMGRGFSQLPSQVRVLLSLDFFELRIRVSSRINSKLLLGQLACPFEVSGLLVPAPMEHPVLVSHEGNREYTIRSDHIAPPDHEVPVQNPDMDASKLRLVVVR